MKPSPGNHPGITLTVGGHPLHVHVLDQGTGVPWLFLHGWGVDSTTFLPLMETLNGQGRLIAPDFPGFGQSGFPPEVWGTREYALMVCELLNQLNAGPCIVVGHSFGGRVAVRLAREWPEHVRGLVLIASAGLKREIPFRRKWRVKTIRGLACLSEKIFPGRPGQAIKQSLYNRIASRDYLQAGALRPIFVKVVNEDLSLLLPAIRKPVLLVWGEDDQETPLDFGRRMQALLPNARLVALPGFDHYTILTRGRHQVSHLMQQFVAENMEKPVL
ncbi:MAG: alpha/beta hydrolase [Candidatus Omnitrophica bacterium]|nr:alpha/beta hydrolase [Candidatus Omnitrophota bacterium]